MKSTLILLAAIILSSCVGYRGGPSPTLIAIGANASAITLPDGTTFKDLNTSDAFRDVLKQVKSMWTNYLMARGLEYVSGLYYNHQGKIVSTDASIKLEELRNAKDIDLAKLKLEELKLMTP